MADDDDRVRIGAQVRLEPERAFEIEIVRRLVEQQDIRLEKENGRERHAHPPAAGEFPAGARLRFLIETEAGKDLRGARGCRMGIDVAEPLVDGGNAMGIRCRLGLGEEGRALRILGKHPLDERVGAARRLLRDMADLEPTRNADPTVVG